jgi:hypothetical protein
MKPEEWKALAAFGLLLGGLALYDGKFALQILTVAGVVVLVRNADKIRVVGTVKGKVKR